MMIGDKSTAGISSLYMRKLQQAEASRAEAKAREKAASQGDQVEISPEAQALKKILQASDSAEEVRWEKVQHLRQCLAQGEYEIPIDGLVARLIADA